MTVYAFDEIFPAPRFAKPRDLRQTWLKDLGWHAEAGEKMGLGELPDFLEVAAPRLDYVKFFHHQAVNSPRDWFLRKVGLYTRHGVTPYFDHSYFMMAHAEGKLEEAIVAARQLGILAIEYMTVAEPFSGRRWRELVRLAMANDLRVIFEYHPPHKFDVSKPTRAGSGEEILQAAMPSLEAGASMLMIDHLNLDLLGERAAEELGKVVAALGLTRIVFEVETPQWREHLESYLRLFGPDVNLANFVPTQVLHVEPMRQEAVLLRAESHEGNG